MKKRLIIFVLYSVWCMHGLAQGLIIPSGAYVIANGGSIETAGDFTNNGSFTHTGGTVLFNGSVQSINGSSVNTFHNLTVSAGSTTSLTSPGQQIANVLLCNGSLNANGNLTLLSTAVKTAAIAGGGSGEVLGNVVVQRYITSAFGYKYFSSPFQSDTVGDFGNDLNLAAGFPAFYRYDESLASNGWVNYTTGSNALQPMQGYAANMGNTAIAKTVDLKGVVNNHNLSLTLYNHNMAYTQGFNLVGNPYPSPVNWDAAGGWTKTNVDNAVYFFNTGSVDQYTGVYSSYVNGVSSNGLAGPTIAAMQGFFVHVTNGSFPVAATLGVNNSARILNSTAAFFRENGTTGLQALLRLTAELNNENGNADAFTVYFDAAATGRFNTTLDALKLLNTDSLTPNLFALAAGTEKLSIRALPAMKDSLAMVPLGLMVKKDGLINLRAAKIADLPAGVYAYLLDKKANKNINLQQDSVYQVLLTAGDYEGRFYLAFSTGRIDDVTGNTGAGSTFAAYYNGNTLMVNPGISNGGRGELRLFNAAGQLLGRRQVSGSSYQAVAMPPVAGICVLQLVVDGVTQSKKIMAGR